MTRAALRGLAGRKLRTLLTALSIVLGVAMVSGTLMLTDSIDRAFGSIFSSSYAETDAVVTGEKVVDYSASGRVTVPESLLTEVRALPGVAEAAGSIADLSGDTNVAKILDRDGEPIQGSNPTFGFGVDPDFPQFNPMELTEGAWARGGDQVVLDAGTADEHGFGVGDRVRVAGTGPVRSFTVVGIAGFGEVDSLGGATIALFDIPTAREVVGKTGFDAISVAAAPGVSGEELTAQIAPLLPRGTQVATGAEQAAADTDDIGTFIDVIRYFLLAFGGIALLVGAFVIFNTLSITVAQRTRELATLRTLGASRRQVLASVAIEALAIGLAASLVGLALGVGLAVGLGAVFGALGLELPQAGLRLTAGTVLAALLTGTLVTLVAGLMPAVRATRVPPIAAVREGAAAAKRRSRLGIAISASVAALSTAGLVWGTLASGLGVGTRLAAIALGAVGLLVGTALLAPLAVRPLAAALGWPAARLGGAPGKLARLNAVVNPGRTAATAAALMIGLALVTFVAVLGAGMKESNDDAVGDQLRADYVLTSETGWEPVTRAAGEAVVGASGVTAISAVRIDRARVAEGNVDVHGVDPATIGDAYSTGTGDGSLPGLADLAGGGAIVRQDLADDEGLAVGDTLAFTTPAGRVVERTVVGVFSPPRFTPLLGSVVLAQSDFDATFRQPVDAFVLIRAEGGARAETAAALESALAGVPAADLRTRADYIDFLTGELDIVLNLLYVLLALSVVVSLFGMVNTLALAVFERTREIGMLRAVGMTRRATRRMVRQESVITALIGAALGMPLGVAAAALVTRSLSEYEVGFSLPIVSLVVFALVAIGAGILAAVLPARRAGRLDVLRALAYE